MGLTAEDFMGRAAALAAESVEQGWGGPFGAVIVRDGAVLAEGQNRVLATGDPTAHAEVTAIRAAAATIGPDVLALVDRPAGSDDPEPRRSRMLMGATIYTTGFPCPMCLGAIYWARLDAVVYACDVTDARAIGFDDAFEYEDMAKPLDQRRIPFQQVGRDLGLPAFRAWRDKPDRHPY